MSAQEREALAEFLVENRDRGRGISAYLFTPLKMADALLAAGWTRPVSDEDMIERAARVLAENWRNMHTNESLGMQRMLATALAAANLLASPVREHEHSEGEIKAEAPPCPNHREVQHRDRKPPWCPDCGWNHGRPAVPPRQIDVPADQVTDTEGADRD